MQNALITIVIAIFLLCPASSIDAAIYKCDNNGVTTIQDKPCKEGKQEYPNKPSSVITKDIHLSWFDRPVYLVGKADCTNDLCKCEGYGRRFSDDENGLRQVLTSFKGSWVRFERQYRKHNKFGRSSAGRLTLEKQACEIAVKQAWVEKLYRKNIVKLRETLNAGTQNDQLESRC